MAFKEEKKLTLVEAMKELEKQYGKGAVIHGDKAMEQEEYETVDTGSIGLNHALGIGGAPRGKIVEIFGWESSGKSTLCQTIIGNAQKQGLKCIYVDAENSLDRDYAKALGINMDDLYIIQMDEGAGEAAYNKVDKLVETGEIDIVIYDSYNALQPKSVMEGEVGDSAIGKHARMLGQAVMKANYLSSKYGTTFIFIGQLRQKIGVMYGSPDVTQGGNALKFYAHVRMEVTRSTTKENSVMDGDDKMGNKTTVKVIKNKLAPPFRNATFNILYGVGIDKFQEIIELGKNTEVLKVRAGVVTYGEQKYSDIDFKNLLIDNSQFAEEVRMKIHAELGKVKEVEDATPAGE
jgi:recombination protein RecA